MTDQPCTWPACLSRDAQQSLADEVTRQMSGEPPCPPAPDSSETVTCTGPEVCCVCQGTGGPVVYRNFEDNPFCAHCCECDCRTIPCTAPGMATVTIRVHAPTPENATQWAQTIADMVQAEYGATMRLETHIRREKP